MGRHIRKNDEMSYIELAEMQMDAKDRTDGIEQQKTHEKKSRNEEITSARLSRLIRKNEYRCGLSGVELDPLEASLDHSVPLSKGGEHVMSNVKIVHAKVNAMKGTMDEDEFIGWCRKIAAWNS